jgi:N-acetylglutamate synthase-like GNAT family acetyltransferase
LRAGERSFSCQAHPATPADLDWIFQLQIDAYSAQHAVARQTLDRWYGSNPGGFSILTMNGRRIGHLTIIPLHAKVLERFVQGTILEQDIDEGCLHTAEEKHLVRNLYVESIVIDSGQGHSILPIKALTRLAHDFVPLISRVGELRNLENVYALAATGRGERFMHALGFEMIKSGQERSDRRALYAANFNTLRSNISGLYDRRLAVRKGE